MDAAMNSAVSGLLAQSSALSTVSNNLANSQTTGYKAVTTQFNSLLTEQASSISYPAGGVQAVARQNLYNQGLIQSTSTTTDMAINGNGLFPVSNGLNSGNISYTRNGSFNVDSSGNLYLAGTNFYLQGWPVNSSGSILSANSDNLASLQPVNIDKYSSSAIATTSYSLQANLPAAAQTTVASIGYTNASGTAENVTLSYSKVATQAATGTNDGFDTYVVTMTAPPGQTLTDNGAGGAAANQQQYLVYVDNTGTNSGVIQGIKGVTPSTYSSGVFTAQPTGTPVASATFPKDTPSDSVGGTTAISWPSTWTVSGGNTQPTWSQFQASTSTNFSQQTSMAVYDSLGVQQTFPVTWTAAGNNEWVMTVGTPTTPDGKSTTGTLLDSGGNPVSYYSYKVQFNTDGSLNSITGMPTGNGTATAPMTTTGGMPDFQAQWLDGAANSTGTSGVAVNLGTAGALGSGKTDGLSQFDTGQTTPQVSVKNSSQNGVQYGQLTGVSVDSSGNVIAAYDNGQKVPIYKVPVVTFANENGLAAQSDGVYAETALSGTYRLNIAGTNGAGSITGQALEASNVNTSVEFSNMISAQQAYSSSSQVISTDKQMFQSLIQAVAG